MYIWNKIYKCIYSYHTYNVYIYTFSSAEVEVITPEDYMGNIIGDLNSRRGIVNELGTRNNLHVVNASVPLAEMFSYIAELRNLSKGRANYSRLPGNRL